MWYVPSRCFHAGKPHVGGRLVVIGGLGDNADSLVTCVEVAGSYKPHMMAQVLTRSYFVLSKKRGEAGGREK